MFLVLHNVLSAHLDRYLLTFRTNATFSTILLAALMTTPNLNVIGTRFLTSDYGLALNSINVEDRRTGVCRNTDLNDLVSYLSGFETAVQVSDIITTIVNSRRLLRVITLDSASNSARRSAVARERRNEFRVIVNVVSLESNVNAFRRETLRVLVRRSRVGNSVLSTRSLTIRLNREGLALIIVTSVIRASARNCLILLIVRRNGAIRATTRGGC